MLAVFSLTPSEPSRPCVAIVRRWYQASLFSSFGPGMALFFTVLREDPRFALLQTALLDTLVFESAHPRPKRESFGSPILDVFNGLSIVDGWIQFFKHFVQL